VPKPFQRETRRAMQFIVAQPVALHIRRLKGTPGNA
jgi:hypothetical protein